MYKLVYIKGISRYDTWKFSSKQEQYNYFDSLVGVSINDYYPPHYTNTIKLELSQVDYNVVNYNYLLLSFNNKYYCYFIDSIEYINEDVYSINITLDSIQTFMFDIDFKQAHIFKRSIERFDDDGNINRGYVRENLSHCDFKLYSQDLQESRMRYIIIYSTKRLGVINTQPTATTRTEPDTQLYVSNGVYNLTSSNCFVYILPIITSYFYWQRKEYDMSFKGKFDETYDYSEPLEEIYELVNDLSSMPNITNMIMCNSIVLDDLFNMSYSFDSDNGKVLFESDILNVEEGNFGNSTSRNFGLFRLPLNFISNFRDYDIDLNFTQNKSLNVLKRTEFVPQIIDENYLKIFFGEKSNYNQIPLYQYNSLNKYNNYFYIRIRCLFDVMTCLRTYWALNNTTLPYDDFITIIVCNTDEGMVLKNDAWKAYISQNKATWTSGYQLQQDMVGMQFASKSLGNAISSLSTFGASQYTSLFASNKVGQMVQARGTASAVANSMSSFGDMANAFVQQYSIDANHRITRENLQACPQQSKQGNNYSNDLNIMANQFIIRIERVADIDNVALEYENEGYTVNQIVNNVNLFNLNDRYYYNVIGAKDIRFDLSILSTNDIKNDIRTRIESGLRLWDKGHNTNILDNIIYDNVENIFIEE